MKWVMSMHKRRCARSRLAAGSARSAHHTQRRASVRPRGRGEVGHLRQVPVHPASRTLEHLLDVRHLTDQPLERLRVEFVQPGQRLQLLPDQDDGLDEVTVQDEVPDEKMSADVGGGQADLGTRWPASLSRPCR